MTALDGDLVRTASPLSSALHSSASKEDALAFYKAQYEQLESELADFQQSSKELEAELERDVEEAEKRERGLMEKVEGLNYEVDEWKAKCKQSKQEANQAQNTLQKEITTLRDQNRSLQLKLRDIEVANDDYERQARNTTSSLEDMESKYNVAVERNVILEGEVKEGEQERENLRIEAQRLRDELSDLKVEAEIRQDKLRQAEAASRAPLSVDGAANERPHSSISEHTPSTTTASSPTVATPPTMSASSATSDAPSPPSPPTSDKSQSQQKHSTPAGSSLPKARVSLGSSTTPRPLHYSTRPPRHSRGPSIPVPHSSHLATPSTTRRTTIGRLDERGAHTGPSSTSLTQIRGLIGKMQRLEQRVQYARSKLPAPTTTPPRGSPRPGSALSHTSSAAGVIPSTVTVRSARKRTSTSTQSGASSMTGPHSSLNFSQSIGPGPISMDRPSSRTSLGMPPPTPTKEHNLNMGAASTSRPSSRASLTSRQSFSHLPSAIPTASSSGAGSRPSSRQSLSGARTPLGHHYPTHAERIARPRSSVGGSYGTSSTAAHGASASVSRRPNSRAATNGLEEESFEADADLATPTPSRRSTYGRETAIPMPSSAKRTSNVGVGAGAGGGRRQSTGLGTTTDMPPPEKKLPAAANANASLGETY